MQEQHLVSVIVPAFNAEKTIERCLDSILAQEYRNIQIIVVNDGSTDNTKEILQSSCYQNNNIKYIEKKNSGVSAARNTGILNAEGEYVVFVDSDDYVLPNMCSELVPLMVSGADLAICGFYIENTYEERKRISPPQTILNQMCKINQCFEVSFFGYLLNVPWNKMFRKSRITHFFNENKKNGEDLEFVLEYAKNNCKIAFCDKGLIVNNIENENSLSRSYKNVFAELSWNQLYIYKYIIDNKIILHSHNFMDYCISQIWTKAGQAMKEKKNTFEEILDLMNIDSYYYKMLEASQPDKMVNKLVYYALLSKNRLWLRANIKIIYLLKTLKDYIK
jgi:glycosyltransferase involved in cell wall biosynthesis